MTTDIPQALSLSQCWPRPLPMPSLRQELHPLSRDVTSCEPEFRSLRGTGTTSRGRSFPASDPMNAAHDFCENVNSPSFTSTTMQQPVGNFPASSSLAREFCSRCWMTRLSGRAP